MTPDDLLKSKVGANIRRAIRRLWVGDMEFEELCEAVQPTAEGVSRYAAALAEEGKVSSLDPATLAAEMQLTNAAVAALAEEMGLGPRKEPECYLPTPEEIRVETAKIRFGWTQAELESRLGGGGVW